MQSDQKIDSHIVPVAHPVANDAVGVEKCYWYVAIVNHNTERKVSEKLTKLGVPNYIPSQTEYKVWKNGRRVRKERLVIPSTVFVYCTETKRREIVNSPFINRFMTNCAGSKDGLSHKPIATIPNEQIETLKFILGNSDTPVNITSVDFKRGDKVRILRGGLKGLEGEVQNMSKDMSELLVRLDIFGCARLTIDTINIERVQE